MRAQLYLMGMMVLTAGCRAKGTGGPDAVRAATQAALDDHAAAAVAKDVARGASLFTVDAIVMFPGLPDIRTRDSIAALMGRAWPVMNPTAVRYRTDDVQLSGDLAVTVARYWITLSPPGRPSIQDSGRYMLVWTYSDSIGWRVARALPNSLIPTPGP